MAIDINLEKNGYKKKGLLGFSYTTYFFYSIVPIFRLDIRGFLIISAVWLLTQGPLYVVQYLPINIENNTKIINYLLYSCIISIFHYYFYMDTCSKLV